MVIPGAEGASQHCDYYCPNCGQDFSTGNSGAGLGLNSNSTGYAVEGTLE